MQSVAPMIKAVVAAIVPFLVGAILSLAAKYDVVVDGDSVTIFVTSLISAVLTGLGVYAAPANRLPSSPPTHYQSES